MNRQVHSLLLVLAIVTLSVMLNSKLLTNSFCC